jgi:hypothetical protein
MYQALPSSCFIKSKQSILLSNSGYWDKVKIGRKKLLEQPKIFQRVAHTWMFLRTCFFKVLL